MLTKRIIPCLDVKEGRVVKGTNFVGLRDAGQRVLRLICIAVPRQVQRRLHAAAARVDGSLCRQGLAGCVMLLYPRYNAPAGTLRHSVALAVQPLSSSQ